MGGGDFVEQITKQIDLEKKGHLSGKGRMEKARILVKETCNKRSISTEALQSGNRLGEVSKVRSEIALLLVKEHGLTMAESARQLGVSISAITKIIMRNKKKSN